MRINLPPAVNYLKPRSIVWRTTLIVMIVMMFCLSASIMFFWRSLYLPELKNHARYVANEIKLLQLSQQPDQPVTQDWMLEHIRLQMITDPNAFPQLEDKLLAEIFTDQLETELYNQLGYPVQVFFDFKPTPTLWIRYDALGETTWLLEPVSFYAEYSPAILIIWLVGTPLLGLITILILVRQLNRPLERLRAATQQYRKTGTAPKLYTHTGSIEIRQVNQAFNELFATINRNQQERNIMLASISHDLRTPLTRMRLTAEMLTDEFLKEGFIYDIADMDAILEQFISYMQDGSDEPIEMVDLNELIEEVVTQYGQTPIQYHTHHLPLLPLRRLSIKRLVVNLVNNAKIYGQPPIIIESELIESDNVHQHSAPHFGPASDATPTNQTQRKFISSGMPYTDTLANGNKLMNNQPDILHNKTLVINISDHGSGVDPDQLERIKQPFERGDTARSTQGSGLGLAIVDRIARQHGGAIYMNNCGIKGGLTVSVMIPIQSPA